MADGESWSSFMATVIGFRALWPPNVCAALALSLARSTAMSPHGESAPPPSPSSARRHRLRRRREDRVHRDPSRRRAEPTATREPYEPAPAKSRCRSRRATAQAGSVHTKAPPTPAALASDTLLAPARARTTATPSDRRPPSSPSSPSTLIVPVAGVRAEGPPRYVRRGPRQSSPQRARHPGPAAGPVLSATAGSIRRAVHERGRRADGLRIGPERSIHAHVRPPRPVRAAGSPTACRSSAATPSASSGPTGNAPPNAASFTFRHRPHVPQRRATGGPACLSTLGRFCGANLASEKPRVHL